MTERHRILVADDDTDAAHALVELLQLEGHEAEAAIGGKEALHRLDTGDYRVAFLDASLPGRCDVESFLDLRRRQAGMRSYLMTGYSIGQLLQQMVKNGGIQMLRASLGHEQALVAVKEAGTDGIILLGTDGEDAAGRLQSLLTDSEYEVAYVTEASQAIAQLEERRVHVLILDLGSRIVEAAGIYAALQAEGHAKPTIILTGSDSASLEDAIATGIITKPYDPRLLLQQIDWLAA
jgi:DNA-binding NtrC family response regulator